ncbi:MAG: hypothetical protein ACRDJC_19260 [Thermomicrobiales bacterium]
MPCHIIRLVVLAALCIGGLDAAGVSAQDDHPSVPDDLSATVDNPYFPLAPGSSRRYEGAEIDPETGETVETVVRERVSPVPDEIAGAPVTTLQVQEYEDGQLTETTSDYHAQDPDGTVYYLGEHVDMYEEGQLVSHEGSWIAGVGDNQAGEFMPAEPRVGDRFAQEQAPGVAEDISTVIAVDLTLETAVGTFSGCIKTQDLNPLDQAIEHKYYCPEVGLVREESASGSLDLVSYTGG